MQPAINPRQNEKKKLRDCVFIRRPFDWKSFYRRPQVEAMLRRGDVISIVSPKNPRECFLKVKKKTSNLRHTHKIGQRKNRSQIRIFSIFWSFELKLVKMNVLTYSIIFHLNSLCRL